MTAAARSEATRALEHELGVVRRRIRRAMATRAKMVHPRLQASSYSILVSLHQSGPCRSSELAEVFAIDKGAVSRQVSRLEELGFVRRDADPEDGRAHLIRVTESAAARLEEIEQMRREWYVDRLADWDSDEIAKLAAQLSRYNAALDS